MTTALIQKLSRSYSLTWPNGRVSEYQTIKALNAAVYRSVDRSRVPMKVIGFAKPVVFRPRGA